MGWLTSVAISGVGKVIFSGSGDKTVRKWDGETGKRFGGAIGRA